MFSQVNKIPLSAALTVFAAITTTYYCSLCEDKSSSSVKHNRLVIAKLGGSAITVKGKFETPNHERIIKIAKDIKYSFENSSSGSKLILIHGAGSFGHFQAKKYDLRSSLPAYHSHWKKGLCQTRNSVLKLNGLIRDSLVDVDIDAVSVSPFPVCRSDVIAHQGNELAPLNLHIRELLNNGIVPVLHGDVILTHSSNGCSILSGDRIIERLCQDYLVNPPKQIPEEIVVVFLTDVAGVFDKPPSVPGAKLIPEILVSADQNISLPECTSASHDVTGGIAEKLKVAIRLAALGITVYIVEAGTEHSQVALAGNRPKIATRVAPAMTR